MGIIELLTSLLLCIQTAHIITTQIRAIGFIIVSPRARVAGLDGIQLTASKKLSTAKEITAYFTTALSCWKFLHDKDYLSKGSKSHAKYCLLYCA